MSTSFIPYEPGDVPRDQQTKLAAVYVGRYERLRVKLDVAELRTRLGSEPGVPAAAALHVLLETGPSDDGPWRELHGFEEARMPGEQVVDLVGLDQFVRASWYVNRHPDSPEGDEVPKVIDTVTCSFGVSAEGVPRAVQPAAENPFRKLSDDDVERQAEAARGMLAVLDAQANKLAEENRAVNDRFKATPTMKLASELAVAQQLAANAREQHSKHYEETHPIMLELERRARVRRLHELRKELIFYPRLEAIADKVADIFEDFHTDVTGQMERLKVLVDSRNALLTELNELEADVGDSAVHKAIDLNATVHQLATYVAELLISSVRRRSLSSLTSDVVWWLRRAVDIGRTKTRADADIGHTAELPA
jgi:hypothetical protein